MFDSINDILARYRAQDWFGNDRPSAAPAPSSPAPAAAPVPGATGPAVPGVYSPAAETVLDERDLYLANSASFDARWAGNSLLERALARHRGEEVEDPAIQPELGAPKHTRPLADPATVIAGVMADSAPKPAAPAAPASRAGDFERENYDARRAAMDARDGGDFLQLARARLAEMKAGRR